MNLDGIPFGVGLIIAGLVMVTMRNYMGRYSSRVWQGRRSEQSSTKASLVIGTVFIVGGIAFPVIIAITGGW